MSAPTPVVWAVTKERDEHRCVACGALAPLSYQHRKAVGMGGSRIRPTLPEGVTACVVCNELFEGSLQPKALRYGWKLRAWISSAAEVPVFYQWSGLWCLLTAEGERVRITAERAEVLMLGVYGDEWLRWD